LKFILNALLTSENTFLTFDLLDACPLFYPSNILTPPGLP